MEVVEERGQQQQQQQQQQKGKEKNTDLDSDSDSDNDAWYNAMAEQAENSSFCTDNNVNNDNIHNQNSLINRNINSKSTTATTITTTTEKEYYDAIIDYASETSIIKHENDEIWEYYNTCNELFSNLSMSTTTTTTNNNNNNNNEIIPSCDDTKICKIDTELEKNKLCKWLQENQPYTSSLLHMLLFFDTNTNTNTTTDNNNNNNNNTFTNYQMNFYVDNIQSPTVSVCVVYYTNNACYCLGFAYNTSSLITICSLVLNKNHSISFVSLDAIYESAIENFMMTDNNDYKKTEKEKHVNNYNNNNTLLFQKKQRLLMSRMGHLWIISNNIENKRPSRKQPYERESMIIKELTIKEADYIFHSCFQNVFFNFGGNGNGGEGNGNGMKMLLEMIQDGPCMGLYLNDHLISWSMTYPWGAIFTYTIPEYNGRNFDKTVFIQVIEKWREKFYPYQPFVQVCSSGMESTKELIESCGFQEVGNGFIWMDFVV